MLDPHMPWLSGADWHMHGVLDLVDIADQLLRRKVGAQQDLVAYQHTIHVGVGVRGLDQARHLAVVGGHLTVQPRT